MGRLSTTASTYLPIYSFLQRVVTISGMVYLSSFYVY